MTKKHVFLNELHAISSTITEVGYDPIWKYKFRFTPYESFRQYSRSPQSWSRRFVFSVTFFGQGLPSLNCPHPITTHLLLHGGLKLRLQGTEKLSLGSLSKADIAFGLTGLWLVSHTQDKRPSNGENRKCAAQKRGKKVLDIL